MAIAPDAVHAHYRRSGLYEQILAGLKLAGKDLNAVTPEDLAPADQFHTRGHLVTTEMAALLAPSPSESILDVGCGIGGPARWLAKRFGCQVTGIDLTADFCAAAKALSELTHLEHLTTFRQGNALQMPFADAAFDAAWSQNVTMNIEDRPALYREIRRVLKPAGRFAFCEISKGSAGPIHFPVPWASDPSLSFLLTQDETRKALERAGFRILNWEDATGKAVAAAQETAKKPPTASPLSLQYVMGPDFAAKVKNQQRNLMEGRTGMVQALVQRVD
jgi:MPBQ/MSBQ methyltransferase